MKDSLSIFPPEQVIYLLKSIRNIEVYFYALLRTYLPGDNVGCCNAAETHAYDDDYGLRIGVALARQPTALTAQVFRAVSIFHPAGTVLLAFFFVSEGVGRVVDR